MGVRQFKREYRRVHQAKNYIPGEIKSSNPSYEEMMPHNE